MELNGENLKTRLKMYRASNKSKCISKKKYEETTTTTLIL